MKKVIVSSVLLVAAVSRAGPAAAEENDVLTAPTGAPLKLIVRRDTALFAEPNVDSRSQPVRQFEFYYALPAEVGTDAKTANDFYRVATGANSSLEVGWIPADDVVEWVHRQALGFRAATSREPALFYGTSEDVERAFRSGDADAPGPISREPRGVEIFSLLPILDERRIDVEGEDIAVFETAFLHSREPSARPETESGGTLDLHALQDELRLEVVFVMDATGSMAPWIAGAKDVVREIADTINSRNELAGRVRFGLVCYRDRGDEFVTRVCCDFERGSDSDHFLSVLDQVEADGGGDAPEQVFSGVHVAITELDWSDVANRHLILIGDAPSHEETASPTSLETVLAAAQPTSASGNIRAQLQKITIHALRVGTGSDDDWRTCGRQFTALAAGRDNPGKFADLDDVDEFVEDLVALMTRRIEDTADIVGGRVEQVRRRVGTDPHAGAIGAVLEHLGPEAIVGPSFARGHVAEIDLEGNATVEPYVLVTYNELNSFHAAVNFCVVSLEGAGSPGDRDVEKLLRDLQLLATQANLGEKIERDTPLFEILQLILGFPVRNTIFELTPERLAAMSQSDYDTWIRNIRASQDLVQGHIENAHWFNLGRETRPQYRHAFIKLTDLP